mmetsp:Transcript_11269/g.34647  ORF Transcript_11269/g.34647 Transcript_11269/m.34647 type:complete len:282 (+) Transcript_11269:823-1668(+)
MLPLADVPQPRIDRLRHRARAVAALHVQSGSKGPARPVHARARKAPGQVGRHRQTARRGVRRSGPHEGRQEAELAGARGARVDRGALRRRRPLRADVPRAHGPRARRPRRGPRQAVGVLLLRRIGRPGLAVPIRRGRRRGRGKTHAALGLRLLLRLPVERRGRGGVRGGRLVRRRLRLRDALRAAGLQVRLGSRRPGPRVRAAPEAPVQRHRDVDSPKEQVRDDRVARAAGADAAPRDGRAAAFQTAFQSVPVSDHGRDARRRRRRAGGGVAAGRGVTTQL